MSSYEVLVLKLRRRAQTTRHTTSNLFKAAADAIDALERDNHRMRLSQRADDNARRDRANESYYATGQPFPYKDPYWGNDE